MSKLRFYIAWIISSLIMFSCFYAWHGMFLNDFSRLKYPKEIFFTVASIAYLIVGLVVSIVYELLVKKTYEIDKLNGLQKKPLLKGLAAGAACGLAFFVIIMVLGVSFSNAYTLENLVLDLCWQITEQTIGGISIGLVHILTYNPAEFMEREMERNL